MEYAIRPAASLRMVRAGIIVALLIIVEGYAITVNAMLLLLPFPALYLWLLCRNWKAAYWVLLASIPLSVSISIIPGVLSTSLPDEPATWLFLLLLPLLLLYRPRLMPFGALLNPVVAVVLLQLAWVAVSAAYSSDVLLSVKYLCARIWLVAAFFIFPFIIFREAVDFRRGFLLLLLPVVATVIVIVIRHAASGFGFMAINDAIGKLYYNHVEYSTILSMMFPVAFIAWPYVDRERRKPWMRVAFAALLALLGIAILLSYARAAILATAFAGVVALGIRYRFAQWIMPIFYAGLIAFAAYMVHENRYLDFRPNYEQTYMHHDINTHLEATFNGRDMSGMERVYRWIAAARMSTEEPVTGWGPNTFVQQYKPFAVPAFRTYVSANEEHSTTHNYFLYLLAEQGWPGMLLYALLIIVVLREAALTYARLKDRFYKRCTLGLAMMFAAAFVNNFFSELTDTHKVGALFFLSMSLIAVLAFKSRMRAGSNT